MKIIINVHFEMRNFLPRLTDPNFFEVLNEEEKDSFCDIENSQIIKKILKEVLKRYFSGKRKP